MIYLFETNNLNPVELEKEIGLTPGDIRSVTLYPEGAVEVETADELLPSTLIKLKDVLKLRSLPRGKKREK